MAFSCKGRGFWPKLRGPAYGRYRRLAGRRSTALPADSPMGIKRSISAAFSLCTRPGDFERIVRNCDPRYRYTLDQQSRCYTSTSTNGRRDVYPALRRQHLISTSTFTCWYWTVFTFNDPTAVYVSYRCLLRRQLNCSGWSNSLAIASAATWNGTASRPRLWTTWSVGNLSDTILLLQ